MLTGRGRGEGWRSCKPPAGAVCCPVFCIYTPLPVRCALCIHTVGLTGRAVSVHQGHASSLWSAEAFPTGICGSESLPCQTHRVVLYTVTVWMTYLTGRGVSIP